MWLDKLLVVVVNKHSNDDNISWITYHALQCTEAAGMNFVNTLLPLFQGSTHTVAMIRFSLNVIIQAVQHINPGQTTVVTAGQPLYALAKGCGQIGPTYDEILRKGGLIHIEIASLCVLGH